jgi:hypothetical protein
MKNPHSAIQFDRDTHTYQLRGKPLESVSSVLARIKPKFDRDRISQRCASKRGISQAQILNEWDKTRDTALAKGSLLHSCIEAELRQKPIPAHTALPEFAHWQGWWLPFQQVFVPIKLEYIIGDKKLGIAGTADCLMERPTSKRKALLDWKSGKNFSDRNKYGERLLDPFSDLDNCEQVMYSMQVSLYRLILERDGFTGPVDECLILHLTDRVAVPHRVTDYRTRLLEWLTKK